MVVWQKLARLDCIAKWAPRQMAGATMALRGGGGMESANDAQRHCKRPDPGQFGGHLTMIKEVWKQLIQTLWTTIV
jgi:hypothetical protein